jgi:hypothetical protein
VIEELARIGFSDIHEHRVTDQGDRYLDLSAKRI